MKTLSQDNIELIKKVITTAKLVNMENLIIDSTTVRAIDENKTVVIIQEIDETGLETIGISRTKVFHSRLILAESTENFSASIDIDPERHFVRCIHLKGKGTKIDFKCANPSNIQVPRKLNDVFKYRITLTEEAILLLQKGVVAMGAENISIVNNDGVSFELIDVNNDVFKHTFAVGVESLDDEDNSSFTYRYPVKTLLTLFKQNPTNSFEIGQKGILKININDLNVFVLPQV